MFQTAKLQKMLCVHHACTKNCKNWLIFYWDDGVLGCSGISWTMCKQSAPRSRQITTPTPHHSIFTGWMLFLTPNQQCQSTEGNVKVTTHVHPFNSPLSETIQVSQCQKGKTNLDFTEARDSEWQWHQLGHMQVCNSLQTDNHASTPPLSFLQAGCLSRRPTNSVKASRANKLLTKWKSPQDLNRFTPDSLSGLSKVRRRKVEGKTASGDKRHEE